MTTRPVVPKVATPCTGLELARSLRDGHVMWCSSAPSAARLACAWAHVAHETGQGAEMTNWNHGHLTAGKSWLGPVYFWGDVPEPIELVPMHFRSYGSAVEGAVDYWALMERRYSTALELFDQGDAYAAALRLGDLGWYTSSPVPYAASMDRLEVKARLDVLPALREQTEGDPATAARLWALGDAVRRGEGAG